MKGKILAVVVAAARELSPGLPHPIPEPISESTQLFGDGGVLDSIGLVSLVVAVEQALQDELQISVALADERAMSQRVSPFRTVGSLVDYVAGNLKGEQP